MVIIGVGLWFILVSPVASVMLHCTFCCGFSLQQDLDTIDRMIEEGEATYNKWRHPDPYIGKYGVRWWFLKKVSI